MRIPRELHFLARGIGGGRIKQVVTVQGHTVLQLSGMDGFGDVGIDGGSVTASHLDEDGTRPAVDRLGLEVLHERAGRIVRVEPLQALEVVLDLQRAGNAAPASRSCRGAQRTIDDGRQTTLRHVLVVERRRDEKARTDRKLRLRVVSSELGDQGSARRVEERRVVFLQQQTGNGSTPPRRVLEHDEAAGAGERRGLEPGLDSGGEYAQDGALRETTIVYVFWIEVTCAITLDIHAHLDGATQLRDVGGHLPGLI